MNRMLVAGWIVLAGVLIGCGEGGGVSGGGDNKAFVSVSYVQPAKVEIPEKTHKIAIAEFSADNSRDASYGELAADKLASQLDEANRRSQRYTLVDRRNLKKIMDEHDLQLAISDSGAAIKAGKIANVDAMIYGSVKVRAEVIPASKTEFRMGSRGIPEPYQKSYNKYYVNVSVSFTMTDVGTSKSIVTRNFTREYDSDKDKDKSFMSLIGMSGSAERKPEMEIADKLLSQAVAEFVAMISPTQVSQKVPLAKSKNKLVISGNKMAAAGDYDGALDSYKEALAVNPADDAALYNTGVVYEAQGKLGEACEAYTKAFRINPDNNLYSEARSRVRGTGAEAVKDDKSKGGK